MADVVSGLAPENQSRIRLLSVGYYTQPGTDFGGFCSKSDRLPADGSAQFGVCSDVPPEFPWHALWTPQQRDVFFFVRTGASVRSDEQGGGWEFACRYSMNYRTADFEGTIVELLDVAAETDSAGAETIVGVDAIDANTTSTSSNSTAATVNSTTSTDDSTNITDPTAANSSNSTAAMVNSSTADNSTNTTDPSV